MIFDKGVKTIQCRKNLFQQMWLGQLDIYTQKNEVVPPTSRHRQKLTEKTGTINLLEGNWGVNLHDFYLAMDWFLDMTKA